MEYDFQGFHIKIVPNEYDDLDITVHYAATGPERLPAYYIPQIRYFHGQFTCDLSAISIMKLEYPEDVNKVMQGIQLSQAVVENIKERLSSI